MLLRPDHEHFRVRAVLRAGDGKSSPSTWSATVRPGQPARGTALPYSRRRDDAPVPRLAGPDSVRYRGGTSSAPENTLPAFEHAVALGYRYLETDVHLTLDGVLVAFHDADLQRTCGVDRTIAATTWAELRELRVDGRRTIR